MVFVLLTIFGPNLTFPITALRVSRILAIFVVVENTKEHALFKVRLCFGSRKRQFSFPVIDHW